MGAIVLHRCADRRRRDGRRGRRGARTRPNPTGLLAAGVPAVEKKALSGSALDWTRTAWSEYQHFSRRYMNATREIVTDERAERLSEGTTVA